MESDLIAWLRDRLPPRPCLRLGPGDDAALLRLGDRAQCVVTTDFVSDGVDFHLASTDPRRIGHKALAVNLSDLAAMAAQPLAAVVALALPREGGLHLAKELFEGLLPLAERFDVAVAGGDVHGWDGPLAICITAIGQTGPDPPLLRRGAMAGDAIVVTGSMGGSILGRHLDFTPRVREAQLLNGRYELHAGIDVSDGLSIDLDHVARESGCGAEILDEMVPVSSAARQLAESRDDGVSALDHALTDGEDFELLLAVPAGEADRMVTEQPLSVPLTRIGQFVAEPGLWRIDGDGRRRPYTPRGFEHRLT